MSLGVVIIVYVADRIRRSFWGYFEPIRQNIPANCSADIEAVVNHIDSVLGTGDESAIHAMKSTFGLQDIVYVDDFAAASA